MARKAERSTSSLKLGMGVEKITLPVWHQNNGN